VHVYFTGDYIVSYYYTYYILVVGPRLCVEAEFNVGSSYTV